MRTGAGKTGRSKAAPLSGALADAAAEALFSPLSITDVGPILSDVSRSTCTKTLGQGTFGIVQRACRHSTPSCSDCFVIKRSEPGGRFGVTEDEALRMEILTRELEAAGMHSVVHFPRVLRMLPDPVWSAKGGAIILMDEIVHSEPVSRFINSRFINRTLTLPDMAFRSLWLQVIGALAEAQSVLRGFQHNDLHTGNVLVRPNTEGHKCTFRTTGGTYETTPEMLVTLIDLGNATAEGWARPQMISSDAWGFSTSSLFDVFLVMNGLFRTYEKVVRTSLINGISEAAIRTRMPWFESWREFMYAWFPEPLLQDEHLDEYDYPASDAHKRLLMQTSAALLPDHNVGTMLTHDFFTPFRTRATMAAPPPIALPPPLSSLRPALRPPPTVRPPPVRPPPRPPARPPVRVRPQLRKRPVKRPSVKRPAKRPSAKRPSVKKRPAARKSVKRPAARKSSGRKRPSVRRRK